MSLTDARSFVEHAGANETLSQQLSELEGRPDSSLQQVIELGAAQGLTFTAKELADALAERQKRSQELDDTQLDVVSGGTTIDQLRMQMMMERQAKATQSVSNMLKKFAETSDTIISNLK
jgi:predicted ribosomally synthesized peptide with nif11-like leader